MFEYNHGIYTPGKIFDEWRADNPDGNQPNRPDFSNFGQVGREWERNVNVQIFNSKLKPLLNNEVKMRINSKTPNKP